MRRTTAPFVPAALLLGAALGAQPKPTVTPADFAQWEVPGAPRISPRGDWTALPISRLNDDNEVRLIGGPRDTTIVVPFGSPVTFGASNEWVGMLIGMSTAERERLTKEKKPIRNSVQLRNLANGQVITEAEVSGFTFSANGRYAALTRYPAEGKQVSDVVVYDLARGTRLTFSSVREHTWADAAGAGGALLALASTATARPVIQCNCMMRPATPCVYWRMAAPRIGHSPGVGSRWNSPPCVVWWTRHFATRRMWCSTGAM